MALNAQEHAHKYTDCEAKHKTKHNPVDLGIVYLQLSLNGYEK